MEDPLSKEELKEYVYRIENGLKLEPQHEEEALKMSLANWHPSRGEERGLGKLDVMKRCGCCVYFKRDCISCPLAEDNLWGCCDGLYSKWVYDSFFNGKEGSEAADNIYQFILITYWKFKNG